MRMTGKSFLVSSFVLMMLFNSITVAQGLTRTPWEMNRGRSYIVLPSPLSSHGEIAAYDSASIPATDDAAWEDAPSLISIGFSEVSIIPSGFCYNAVDFTYFQTFVDVPVGTTVSTFTIDFSGIDDGGRVSLFNSSYPEGLVIPGSYIYLNGTATTNLASYVTEGVNRVVVTQVDDCPDGNNLHSAIVVLNGETVAVPGTEQTFTVLGANGTTGEQDPFIQALPEGETTWSQAYLTGPHIWGQVPGTNSWLNFDPNPEVGINTSTPYRIRFMVPEDFTDPSMTFQVKADNLGIIWINDTYIDSVEGEGTPDVPDAVVEEALHVGMNEIRITMVDWGGVVGLNYRIDVTMTSAEDISDAVLTPEDAAELNNPPVADAGDDQVVEGNLVTLDGSGSSDPDGNLLTYAWYIDEGEMIATGVNPTVELPSGYHDIGLQVSDGELTDWDWTEVFVDGEDNAQVSIRLIPRFGSEYVEPGQGRVIYDVVIENDSPYPFNGLLRLGARSMETGRMYGPLAWTPARIFMPPWEIGAERLAQFVPAWLPAGEYILYGKIGNAEHGVMDEHGFSVMRYSDGEPVPPQDGDELAGWNTIYYDSGAETMEGDIWTADGIQRADGSPVLGAQALSADDDIMPATYNLSQNYPNPFNPSTTISFALESAGDVSLRVYDVNGVEVAQLASGHYEAGQHSLNFGPENMSSGTYLYVLETGSFREVKRMVYLK